MKPRSQPRGELHTKVKTARKRSNSSARWLERQLNDPYVAEAKRQGWRSRAAFKLIEIDDKHRFLQPGQVVVDLGSAPGGWSQVAAKRISSSNDAPSVIAIDKLPVDPIAGVAFILGDFSSDDAETLVLERCEGRGISVVMSDMAAETTGHKKTDHLRTAFLFELSADFALQHLEQGGVFLSKVFRGGAEDTAIKQLRSAFDSVHHIKPPSSRKESPELYVLAKGFRGTR